MQSELIIGPDLHFCFCKRDLMKINIQHFKAIRPTRLPCHIVYGLVN